jgi:hypothetical protein
MESIRGFFWLTKSVHFSKASIYIDKVINTKVSPPTRTVLRQHKHQHTIHAYKIC